VQAVLAARIDRLAPEEKALLQQLSVIGRTFPLRLAKAVVAQPDESLYRLLDALQRKEFLYEQPALPDVEYVFKHALTQEVAYQSLLIERRKVLHEQTGRAIEQLYQDNLEERYGELAHHYSHSNNTTKAIDYLHKAGQQAAQRSANEEAISQLTVALELLKTLPETSERDRKELAILVTLGMPLQITRGYNDREAERAYARARELCEHLGETSKISAVLFGLWVFYLVRADLRTAQQSGEQLLALGENARNPALLAEAHCTLADTLFHRGDFPSARDHGELGLSHYRLRQHQLSDFPSGYEIGALCHVYRAWAWWMLGYPDQALAGVQEAVSLAQKASYPPSLAIALDFSVILLYWRRDKQAARAMAERAIALCSEHGFSYWLAFGTIVRGWCLFEDGEQEDGIVQIRQGIAMLQVNGELDLPYWLALLAEVYGRVGRIEEGLGLLAEAHGKVQGDGERFEAELYRLKGELTLQEENQKAKGKGQKSKIKTEPRALMSDAQGEAEVCFLKAIDIAQKQHAKSLELRASVSLARLWQTQGKQHEARTLLADVYNWFTEGFDTKGLQEARALLEELTSHG
jgi:predicted ATPase